MQEIELNTWIGAALVAMLPASMIWTILSARVLIQTENCWHWRNYRFAVTMFLAVTTLNIADFIRLRFKLGAGMFRPDAVDWIVLLERWAWAFVFWWATYALYGHFVPKLLGFRQRPVPRAERDPYLSDESVKQEVREKAERVGALSASLRIIADELMVIKQRIERDDPPLAPRGRQEGTYS